MHSRAEFGKSDKLRRALGGGINYPAGIRAPPPLYYCVGFTAFSARLVICDPSGNLSRPPIPTLLAGEGGGEDPYHFFALF
ncbi:hypothetical protein SUGI_1223330 [Cryptomeria japonica]|uniref:Uncharacterized protein n=1 Tax=Cryptomeria japonica TaxID=3369 RepID=A0AAD3NNW6_CRYJA|nr:hypothetical protein SUGI_1223330 [Cryptomeria japonica]